MELRAAVHSFVADTKNIMERLRDEGEALSRGELHILEVQLYLLQKEVAKWKDRAPGKPKNLPPYPPFMPDKDDNKK